MNSLTPRQVELISLLAHGYTSTEVREKMGIADKTMDCHVTNIKKRLNARTREQAVVIAVISGIVTIEAPK